MSHRDNHRFNILGLFGLLCFFMVLTACNNSDNLPFPISEHAVRYSFPIDNFLALKSVILDQGTRKNMMALEFDDSSEYISRRGFELILENMEVDTPDYFWNIIVESSDRTIDTHIKVVYGKRSTFLIMYLEPKIECHSITIRQTDNISIEAPWDEPKLELMRTGYEQDGKEGTLFRSQKFDKELMKWDKCIDEFVEDMEPVGD